LVQINKAFRDSIIIKRISKIAKSVVKYIQKFRKEVSQHLSKDILDPADDSRQIFIELTGGGSMDPNVADILRKTVDEQGLNADRKINILRNTLSAESVAVGAL